MDRYLKVRSSAARTSFPALLIIAVLSLGLQASGCRRATDRADGLTLGVLKNCKYHIGNSTVRLQDGSLTIGRSPGGYFYAGLADAALGDLDGDGKTDAAVILKSSSGGRGMSYELTAIVAGDRNAEGEALSQVNSIELGDRVEILTLLVLRGDVVLEMNGRAPGDPAGSPSVRVKRTYTLSGGELVEKEAVE